MLEKVFSEQELITFKTFLNIVENTCSEIFLFILIFLLESRPFNEKTLNNYDIAKKSNTKSSSKSPENNSPKKFVRSPSLDSKFSPILALSRSPTLKSSLENENFNLDSQEVDQKKNMLLKLAGKESNIEAKKELLKYNTNLSVSTNVPVLRKDRKPNVNELENDLNNSKCSIKHGDEDIPILPATKYKLDSHYKINTEQVIKISKE
jgi:hypothetical protein